MLPAGKVTVVLKVSRSAGTGLREEEEKERLEVVHELARE